MRNWTTVFRFELQSLVKKKTFRITTVLLSLAALVIASVPAIMSLFQGPDVDPVEGGQGSPAPIALHVEAGALDMDVLAPLLAPLPLQMKESAEEVRVAVSEGSVERGYLIHGPQHFTTVMHSTSAHMGMDGMLYGLLNAYGENLRLTEAGYDANVIRNMLGGMEIQEDREVLGRDGAGSYFTGYILIMVAFMLVMFYGNNVATYVAREKSDRTMEILITSTESGSLIAGKVLASAVVGVLQLSVILGAAYAGFRLSRTHYDDGLLQFLNLNLELDAAAVYLLFMVTGYFLYLFLYAALGALVSKVEDVPSSTALMTMLIMGAYFLAMFSLNGIGGGLLTVGSFVPVTSFMAMFVRYLLVEVPFWELLASYALLLGSTVLVAWASFKIYRFGTLNYGNSGNVFQLVKRALRSRSEG